MLMFKDYSTRLAPLISENFVLFKDYSTRAVLLIFVNFAIPVT